MIDGDNQIGFFWHDIPSPPHPNQTYSIWFHKRKDKTIVSSLEVIPFVFFGLLSYPSPVLFGKKRVKKRNENRTSFFSYFQSLLTTFSVFLHLFSYLYLYWS